MSGLFWDRFKPFSDRFWIILNCFIYPRCRRVRDLVFAVVHVVDAVVDVVVNAVVVIVADLGMYFVRYILGLTVASGAGQHIAPLLTNPPCKKTAFTIQIFVRIFITCKNFEVLRNPPACRP